MDVHDPKTRSFNMSKIRSKNTKPELQVRSLCFKLGLRYRINKKLFKTNPDMIFKKYRTVIFVNGCFWHSHSCKYGLVVPKTNQDFWRKKREQTVIRDEKNYEILAKNGWHTIVIWECELKHDDIIKKKLLRYFFKDQNISLCHKRF